MIHVDVTISGKVQGVGFRMGIRHKAKELKLNGWVKNNDDGTVSAAAEGDENDIQQFLSWCHEGPILARVDEVRSKKGKIEGWTAFSVK